MTKPKDAPGGRYTGKERRRYPRVEIIPALKDVGVLRGQDTVFDVPIAIVEMSAGGIAVQTTVALPIGTIHNFRFTRDQGAPLVIAGRIVHSLRMSKSDHAPLYISGVEFLTDRHHDAVRAITELITALR